MTIGTDFNAWFEGEVEGLTLEERVDHLKRDMIFWRDTAMKEAEQYQSLAAACHESDLKLEARAKLWKKLAKNLYFDLLLAHEELDEADNMDDWFT